MKILYSSDGQCINLGYVAHWKANWKRAVSGETVHARLLFRFANQPPDSPETEWISVDWQTTDLIHADILLDRFVAFLNDPNKVAFSVYDEYREFKEEYEKPWTDNDDKTL